MSITIRAAEKSLRKMNKLNTQLKLLQERGPRKYCDFLLLKFTKFLKIGFYCPTFQPKDVDIVYVVHKKDADKLCRSIKSLSLIKNISIKNIFIISNDVSLLQNLIKDDRVSFIEEGSVLDFNVRHYQYPLQNQNSNDRCGWLFQQFLKLGWSFYSNLENYIVVDADTHFISPISFFDKKGRFIFFGAEEWWPPYFKAFSLLFGEKHQVKWSRTAHMMIFNKKHVTDMLAELENIHGCTWHEAIAKTRHLNNHACHSEYETYANWMLLRHPEKCNIRPSYNTNANNPKLTTHRDVFNSISSHSYL